MLFKKLVRTAWKYKIQFSSMIIMIALGVGVFLGFNVEWNSIEENILPFMEETNYADYRIYSNEGFSDEDIESIRSIEGVDSATRFFSVNANLVDSESSIALTVSEDYNVSTMHIVEGKEYDDSLSGIWLSDRFAEAHDIKVGDSISIAYLGNDIEFEVLGLAKSGEYVVCTSGSTQLMPDASSFGFGYITPDELSDAMSGFPFYPQINIISSRPEQELQDDIEDALAVSTLVSSKEDHIVYANVEGEVEEGKTMASVLPVLFLSIALLTMITTMHRIASNEKTQIGTLKALGFKDRTITMHYMSYGLMISIIGTSLGIGLGYLLAYSIIHPGSALSIFFDIPAWTFTMPDFSIPLLAFIIFALTAISVLSIRRMMRGNAAESLMPYTPKHVKNLLLERTPLWKHLSFAIKWNARDILRHKSRSLMTLVGVIGCMMLLISGLGMKDTMTSFLNVLDEDTSNYKTKITLTEDITNEEALSIVDDVDGDWLSMAGIEVGDENAVLEVYDISGNKIRFVDEDNNPIDISSDGVYLCLRLADDYKIGDNLEFSIYGEDEPREVKVAGFFRSSFSKSVVITEEYAKDNNIPYQISTIFTDEDIDSISESDFIENVQSKKSIIDSYESFTDIMNTMVIILVITSMILGAVVLYNLGVMSYVERYRELATLKVLGFKDKHIGKLLIMQNMWLTLIGMVIGFFGGIYALEYLILKLSSEYEMKSDLGILTYSVSILITFGVSLVVGLLVAAKNKHIDMVEALKSGE